uniref:Solute carrier family 25 member 46 n=1 Tax=Ditylenchus dipsaci TaxID=166011 RepID=A0A915EB39_9BILA
MARRYVSRKSPEDRTRFHAIMPEMFASMTSGLMADLACYPLETVLHRLYIQGTRTLIDNLDNGIGAVHIQYKYNGFFHCFSSIVNKEGPWALFNGVGAVVLQYSLQFCVLNILRAIFGWIHGSKKALKGALLQCLCERIHLGDPALSYQRRPAASDNVNIPQSSALFPSTFAQTQADYARNSSFLQLLSSNRSRRIASISRFFQIQLDIMQIDRTSHRIK